jgi:hypothetical protein
VRASSDKRFTTRIASAESAEREVVAQRVIGGDAQHERVVEVSDVVDAVGNQVERLEQVVEPAHERLPRRLRQLGLCRHLREPLGVVAEAAQPGGKHVQEVGLQIGHETSGRAS